jgi:hypothetical protein
MSSHLVEDMRPVSEDFTLTRACPLLRSGLILLLRFWCVTCASLGDLLGVELASWGWLVGGFQCWLGGFSRGLDVSFSMAFNGRLKMRLSGPSSFSISLRLYTSALLIAPISGVAVTQMARNAAVPMISLAQSGVDS